MPVNFPIVAPDEDDDSDATAAFFFPFEGDNDPRPIIADLVADLEEFHDLKQGDAAILVVFRASPKLKNGRTLLGTLSLPRFMGGLGEFAGWMLARITGGVVPDYIMTLDATWWLTATTLQRKGLVHHELMHFDIGRDKEGEPRFNDEGMPVWALKAHDLEEFGLTVERFGDFAGDVLPFVKAAKRGGVTG